MWKWFFLMGVFVASFSAAGPLDASPADSLRVELNRIKTFKAAFRQSMPTNNETDYSTGYVWIKRPGAFRWDIESPFRQKLLIKKGVMWTYDEDLEQAVHSVLPNDSRLINPVMLLSDKSDHLLSQYRVSVKHDFDCVGYTLKPISGKSNFKNFSICFKNHVLHKLIVENQFYKKTVFTFSKIGLNGVLDDSVFNLNLPSSVEVIYSKGESRG